MTAPDATPTMTPADVSAWVADMKAKRIAAIDAECARLLGMHPNSIAAMKQRGADRRTALACRALVHLMEPYKAR
ncbi:hypothetical protein FHS82_001038 [Pseudochelatococcus lubricantis]|uniref:XRE family transcriptional regulator n=1 Tax=Pseudochelatococcus lubricantis TaxID=1538102 RepID=A0ABX0UW74_9HYPH|nr:hypothetical protein [Pseudochelatococcus lubricantis]NIJ57212.1 hypothetical protein [Pseudochelatococcus lubricantis]